MRGTTIAVPDSVFASRRLLANRRPLLLLIARFIVHRTRSQTSLPTSLAQSVRHAIDQVLPVQSDKK